MHHIIYVFTFRIKTYFGKIAIWRVPSGKLAWGRQSRRLSYSKQRHSFGIQLSSGEELPELQGGKYSALCLFSIEFIFNWNWTNSISIFSLFGYCCELLKSLTAPFKPWFQDFAVGKVRWHGVDVAAEVVIWE